MWAIEIDADGVFTGKWWSHTIGRTPAVAGYRRWMDADGWAGSIDTTPSGTNFGIEFNQELGQVIFRATGESPVTTTVVPTVGNRIIFGLSVSDLTTSDNTEYVTLNLIPSGANMTLTYSDGCNDATGRPVTGAVAGNCLAVLTEGTSKCYNTIATCARVDNYSADSLSLRFCSNTQTLPNDGNYYLPFLEQAKVTPCTINPGGGNKSASALGTRATLSATFSDHPHTDRFVDPYAEERIIGRAQYDGIGHNPFERSTFWRKWAARNLYKINRTINHVSGYIDAAGNLTDTVTRSFVITGFDGPNKDGRVSIQGKDILTKVNNDKAQCPVASTGKLSATLTIGGGSATLVPTGIGALEYPASGHVRIGSEICSFTRSGDVLTLTRAQYNTAAEEHATGDTVQLCAVFTAQTPADIIETLLVDYSGIPLSYIDTYQWAAETSSFLPRTYSTIITEPVGVAALLGELGEQMYLYTWFDEREALIKLRAVRPAYDETITYLTEDSLMDVSVSEQADQLITRVVINYGPIDYTRGLDEVTNYAVTDVFVATAEEDTTHNNGSVTKTIFSRWLQSSDGAAATDLGEKLLARYKVPPRKVTFKLDAKDRDLWVGDFASVTSIQFVDADGEEIAIPVQVMSVTEDKVGTTFGYVAQQFVFEEPADPTDKSIDIAGDLYNVNLRDLYDSKYGTTPPVDTDVVTVTIRTGVVIGSTSTATPALDIGTWPSGVEIVINNYGVVAGKGGNGGSGTSAPSTNGGDGGTAIYAAYPIALNNLGVIGGGGGGGGGSYWDQDGGGPGIPSVEGGGGGAGRNVGSGGWGSIIAGFDHSGNDGTLYYGGDAEIAAYVGGGGDLGFAGGTSSIPGAISNGTGGAAGLAIDGIAFVTYTTEGDIRGPVA
jgi:hypothetical protein